MYNIFYLGAAKMPVGVGRLGEVYLQGAAAEGRSCSWYPALGCVTAALGAWGLGVATLGAPKGVSPHDPASTPEVGGPARSCPGVAGLLATPAASVSLLKGGLAGVSEGSHAKKLVSVTSGVGLVSQPALDICDGQSSVWVLDRGLVPRLDIKPLFQGGVLAVLPDRRPHLN